MRTVLARLFCFVCRNLFENEVGQVGAGAVCIVLWRVEDRVLLAVGDEFVERVEVIRIDFLLY